MFIYKRGLVRNQLSTAKNLGNFSTGFMRLMKVDKLVHILHVNFHTSLSSLILNLRRFAFSVLVCMSVLCLCTLHHYTKSYVLAKKVLEISRY